MIPMNILDLQKCQLSKDNDTSALMDVSDPGVSRGEMPVSELSHVGFYVAGSYNDASAPIVTVEYHTLSDNRFYSMD